MDKKSSIDFIMWVESEYFGTKTIIFRNMELWQSKLCILFF